jgi:acetamidase/formamidase
VVTIKPGESVRFWCPAPRLPQKAVPADVLKVSDINHPHTIVGPVAIDGAKPGDVLVVDILDIKFAQDFGHCYVIPGLGLLADQFTELYIHNFTFLPDGTSLLRPGVRVKLRPFCGIMGVAPAAPGGLSTVPPRAIGGNMDIARLTAGTKLFLPVEVDGALFSCGDGHAAQGHGEVCGIALETALDVTLRFDVRQGRRIDHPEFQTPPAKGVSQAARYATTATGPDLYDSSKRAISQMIDYLTSERKLSRIEAYVLCSVAVDLTIEEIVDLPNWLVSASLPLDVFEAD